MALVVSRTAVSCRLALAHARRRRSTAGPVAGRAASQTTDTRRLMDGTGGEPIDLQIRTWRMVVS